jgi:signal transduction histidine kinase
MDLRTLDLEQRDLLAALQSSVHRWAAGSSVDVQVDVSCAERGIPDAIEQNLFRIAQEAVANALKHGRPQTILVEVATAGGELRLRVKDDGQGFDPRATFSMGAGHFGILGMRERAERIGGTFDLFSHPGSGTNVEVKVPLDAAN